MELDAEDVMAGAIGSVLGRMVLFCVAVYIGSLLGGAGIAAGVMVESGRLQLSSGSWLWSGPLLLISMWAFLNIPVLMYFLIRFVRNDGDSYLNWGIVIGMEALFAMLGWVRFFVKGWVPMISAWTTCILLLVMMGTGIWLVRQHLINLWARDIGLLRAENASRRAEREIQERERMSREDER